MNKLELRKKNINIFTQHIADEILKIKISANHNEDNIKLIGEKNGELTVNSAYKFFPYSICVCKKINKDMGISHGLAYGTCRS